MYASWKEVWRMLRSLKLQRTPNFVKVITHLMIQCNRLWFVSLDLTSTLPMSKPMLTHHVSTIEWALYIPEISQSHPSVGTLKQLLILYALWHKETQPTSITWPTSQNFGLKNLNVTSLTHTAAKKPRRITAFGMLSAQHLNFSTIPYSVETIKSVLLIIRRMEFTGAKLDQMCCWSWVSLSVCKF